MRLTGGYTVTFGVWIGVHPDDLRRAFKAWWSAEYEALQLEGRLANALPVWNIFAAPVGLAVTDPQATPYCVSSSDQDLSAVLKQEWDHELVLGGLPR